MDLYIQIVDGQMVNHPILKSNLLEALPGVNLSDANCGFVPFQRIPEPDIGVYQVNEGVTYKFVDGVAKDVWAVRPMTPEEKQTKIAEAQAYWEEHGHQSWIFDEDTCSYLPPVPYPDDGQIYQWNEDTTSWELVNE